MKGTAAYGNTPGRCSVLRIAFCIAQTNFPRGGKRKYRVAVRAKPQAGIYPRHPMAIEERRSYALQAR